jgi:hypothetical protein
MPAEMLAQKNEHRGYEQRFGERGEHTDRLNRRFAVTLGPPNETDRVVVPLRRLTSTHHPRRSRLTKRRRVHALLGGILTESLCRTVLTQSPRS